MRHGAPSKWCSSVAQTLSLLNHACGSHASGFGKSRFPSANSARTGDGGSFARIGTCSSSHFACKQTSIPCSRRQIIMPMMEPSAMPAPTATMEPMAQSLPTDVSTRWALGPMMQSSPIDVSPYSCTWGKSSTSPGAKAPRRGRCAHRGRSTPGRGRPWSRRLPCGRR